MNQSIETFFIDNNITICCPKCLSDKRVRNGANRTGIPRYRCKSCGKGYSITTNTLFEGTSYSADEVINAVHAVLINETSVYIEKNISDTERSNSSAWLLMHKIRHILARMPMPKLSGVVQISGKYIRESQKGARHLISYLEPSQTREARHQSLRSECGIFGSEYINVLCAVDEFGHYWAKCVNLGPMSCRMLERALEGVFVDVSYLCSDSLGVYGDFCKKKGYRHYVESSDCTDVHDEVLIQRLYKEKLYPHIDNMSKKLSLDEFIEIKTRFGLTLDDITHFHNDIGDMLRNSHGVSAEYVADYIGSFVYIKNYISKHKLDTLTRNDAIHVLVEMIEWTIKQQYSPTLKDIASQTITHLPRPSKNNIKKARDHMEKARQVIIDPNDKWTEYEGTPTDIMFDKHKFFRQIGTTRLDELAIRYGVYSSNKTKSERIHGLAKHPKADMIIYQELALSRYGCIEGNKWRTSHMRHY